MRKSIVSYRWFEPAETTDTAIILPNQLGSNFETDHGFVAQLIARETGALVLAYERIGTGAGQFSLGLRYPLHHMNYLLTAAQTGRQLAQQVDGSGAQSVILAGHSAGATDAIFVARSQTLQANRLAFTDPAGMEAQSWARGFSRWLGHQCFVEPSRPESMDNQHPGPSLSLARFTRHSVADIVLYGRIWQTDRPLQALHYMATEDDFMDTKISVAFPEFTFTAPPDTLKQVADDLNQSAAANGHDVNVEVLPGVYHSYFDDAVRMSDFIQSAIE